MDRPQPNRRILTIQQMCQRLEEKGKPLKRAWVRNLCANQEFRKERGLPFIPAFRLGDDDETVPKKRGTRKTQWVCYEDDFEVAIPGIIVSRFIPGRRPGAKNLKKGTPKTTPPMISIIPASVDDLLSGKPPDNLNVYADTITRLVTGRVPCTRCEGYGCEHCLSSGYEPEVPPSDVDRISMALTLIHRHGQYLIESGEPSDWFLRVYQELYNEFGDMLFGMKHVAHLIGQTIEKLRQRNWRE